jgi:hypothetical protein
MKKKSYFKRCLGITSLALALTGMFFGSAKAQVSSYSFSQSNGVYTPVTGGTLLGDTASDNQRFVDISVPLGDTAAAGAGLPIGFTFSYNGLNFDVFGVDNNGWIGLGNGSVNIRATQNTPISSAAGANIIAGLARNIQGQAGSSLRFETTGTAPNRVLTVQWSGYRMNGLAGDNINFQIKLFETTNVVSVVYGTCSTLSTSNNRAAQVGLKGSANTDFNNRTTTTDWSNTTAGVANNNTCRFRDLVVPVSGLTFSWTAPPPCTAPPVAGNAVSTPSTVCSGATFRLSLSGNSVGTGLTYQWESSPDNINWTAIGGATTAAYNTSQTVATYYRCQVTCSGSTVPSASVQVAMNSFDDCYCATNLHFFACSAADNVNTVAIAGTTLNNANTGCTSTNGTAYTVYPPTGSTTGTLQKTVPYTISITSASNTRLSVWIDYDHSGTFDVNEWTYVDSIAQANIPSSATIVIPNTALNGITGMRIRSGEGIVLNQAPDACAFFFSGETEDYRINIVAATPCSGAPTAGTVIATSEDVCFGNPFTLSLSGSTVAGGITYQWQSSPDNASWTNIPGATSSSYSDFLGVTTYYRCILTCSGQSATTPSKQISLKPYNECYCDQNLHSQACATAITAIDAVSIDNTSLNNSGTGCNDADGNAYSKYPGTGATSAELNPGASYTIRVTSTDTSKVSMWIDYDHSGTFDIPEWTQVSIMAMPGTPELAIFTVPANALTGTTVMRIRNRLYTAVNDSISPCTTFGSGETEDYIISIKGTSSINESLVNDLSVFPNPASQAVNVRFSYTGASLTVKLLSMNGQEVYSDTKDGNGIYNNSISLKDLSGGLYLLQIITDHGVVNRKIVKN